MKPTHFKAWLYVAFGVVFVLLYNYIGFPIFNWPQKVFIIGALTVEAIIRDMKVG